MSSGSNKEIFNSSTFKTPLNREINCKDFIANYFKSLREKLDDFSDPIKSKLKPKLPLIELQIEKINNAFDAYYSGFPGKAFEQINDCLNKLKAENILPIQQLQQKIGQDEFYRVRLDIAKGVKSQMFHIPFELREIVATQRYSIPGLPCLYLSDSIYTCWEELNQPDLNSISVSRFDLNESNLKLLFLNDSHVFHQTRSFHNNEDGIPSFLNGVVHYLTLLPLLASCSIRVKQTHNVFKPEYIIPQLILQWVVLTEGLDGVKYRSNQISPLPGMVGSFSNIVIPAQSIDESGHCKILKSKIKLTEPISYKIIQISPKGDHQKLTAEQISMALQRVATIELIAGTVWDYANTEFGILEDELRRFKTDFL